MFDIDHFKKINDNYGHLFGDYVLQKLSEIAVQNIRDSDSIYRYAGDEFFIFLPETSHKDIVFAANRLMEVIRNHTFEYDGQKATITVSMGGSLLHNKSKDKMALIKLTDQALYKAKETGRDRAVFCWEGM